MVECHGKYHRQSSLLPLPERMAFFGLLAVSVGLLAGWLAGFDRLDAALEEVEWYDTICVMGWELGCVRRVSECATSSRRTEKSPPSGFNSWSVC